MLGIDASKEVLDNLGEFIADAVDITKTGLSISSARKAFELFQDISKIASSLPSVLPELKDLTLEEMAELGACTHAMLQKVVDRLS